MCGLNLPPLSVSDSFRFASSSQSHCRLKYDTEDQQLEIADFYDFRPSYPDYAERQARKAERRAAKAAEKAAKKAAASGAAEGWEDVEEEAMAEDGNEEDGDVEVVYEEASASADDSDSDDSSDNDDDDLPSGTSVTYGDTKYELVLPSGARIGHRAHRNAFKQNALPYLNGTPFDKPAHASQAEIKPSAHSQALLQLVPAMMKKDRTHAPPLHAAALVPAKGAGYGRRGASAGEVIKARNKGEAKHAGKATREFADIRHFQKQANIRGEKGNNQKHVRYSCLFTLDRLLVLTTCQSSVPRLPPPVDVSFPAGLGLCAKSFLKRHPSRTLRSFLEHGLVRVDFPVRSSVFCLLDFVHLYRVLLKFMGVARNPPPLPA